MSISEFFVRHALTPSKLAVAVSGGVDSTALLVMLAEWTTRPFMLAAIHVDHHLRGRESDGDRAFVIDLCRRLSVPVEAVDAVPDESLIRSSGLENAARVARRAALTATARLMGADYVALAHHADDQAESVLLALLRGGGARRLAGMRAVDAPVIRPLLHVRRREIEQFVTSRGLEPGLDSTNADTRFLRNRIRHDVLPLLESIQPRIREHLDETAEQLREIEGIVSDAEAAVRRAYVRDSPGETVIAREALERHSHLFRRILLDEAFARDAAARELTAGDLRSIETKLKGGARRITITKDLELFADATAIRLCPRAPAEPPRPVEIPIPVGQEVEWPLLGWRIRVDRLSEDDGSRDADRQTFSLPGEPRLVLRNRRPGDRFHPFGLSASKKLKDLLIDRKIDRTTRDKLPLLVHENTIVWIGGVALAEPFAVRPQSRYIFRVSVARDESPEVGSRTDADPLDRKSDT